jgi:hypothetical protein
MQKLLFIFLFLICLILLIPAIGNTQVSGIAFLGRTDNIANLADANEAFINIYAARYTWGALDTGGVYNFTAIGNTVTGMAAIGKGLTLTIHPSIPPDYVTSSAGETYLASIAQTDHTVPVPWDTHSIDLYEDFIQTLAIYTVGGTQLKNRSELKGIRVGFIGLKGLDDDGRRMVALGSYNRTIFINAVLRYAHIISDNFPNIPIYIEFAPITDSNSSPRLDTALIDALTAEFDGSPNVMVGFFAENLKGNNPLTSTQAGINFTHARSHGSSIYFQACGSWLNGSPCTFTHEDITPSFGFRLGYESYGSTYYEIYTADLLNPSWERMFTNWATVFSGGSFPDEFVDNYYEIPNTGINTFTIGGHLASGGLIHPKLTSDGLTMFYLRVDDDASCYTTPPYTCNYGNIGGTEADIWKATRANTTPTTPWTTPIRLTKGTGTEINTDHFESSISISTWSPMDGKIIYFCSDRNGLVRPFVAVYNEGTGIFDVQSQSEFASFINGFPLSNLLGISISANGHFLLLDINSPGLLTANYYYAECTTWNDTLHRCTLWGTPVNLTTMNVTKPTTEPLIQYILDTPVYQRGSSFAASFGPDNDYIYYTFSRALNGFWPVGDFITRIENNGPGVNISINNIELVHGDLNGVVNYTSEFFYMRKLDEGKLGTLGTNAWYTETPYVWKNPTNSRYYIYAHTDSKLYMGEIIQSSNQCYGDCDCEDGNANAFETCTIASHTCPGGAVPGVTGPINIIINY